MIICTGRPVPTGPWRALSAALPAGMTYACATTAKALTGANYDVAVYTDHAINVARFERLASGKIGLLIEGAETVGNVRSSEISDAAWAKSNLTSASNALAGPFGMDGTTGFANEERRVTSHFESVAEKQNKNRYCLIGASVFDACERAISFCKVGRGSWSQRHAWIMKVRVSWRSRCPLKTRLFLIPVWPTASKAFCCVRNTSGLSLPQSRRR